MEGVKDLESQIYSGKDNNENKNMMKSQNSRESFNDSQQSSQIQENQNENQEEKGIEQEQSSSRIYILQENDNIQQELLGKDNDLNLNFNGQSIEQPQMVDLNQKYIPPPLAPPPAVESQVIMGQPIVMEHPNNEIQGIINNIRDINEIEHCMHSNKKQILYITSPKIISSFFLLLFFIGGLVCMGIGLVFIIIILIGENLCDGDCGSCVDCKNSYCNMCDQDVVLSCCNCTTALCDDIPKFGVIPYDITYYQVRHNRKKTYDQYSQSKGRDASCGETLADCFCCSCFDNFSFKGAKKGCILNKIEVYCTNCNSKLKEKHTGNKKIFPILCLGVFGFGIFTAGLLLYIHKSSN